MWISLRFSDIVLYKKSYVVIGLHSFSFLKLAMKFSKLL